MAKKKNKNKKRMSPEQKENLKSLFYRHLWSNDTCIESARHNPWWVALIFFLISIMIPVIPSVVTNMNAFGSQVFQSQTFGFDTQVTRFALDMETEGIDFEVQENNEKHILVDKDGAWAKKYGLGNELQYVHENEASHQYDFAVYFTDKIGDELEAFNTSVSLRVYQKASTTLFPDYTDKEKVQAKIDELYRPNTLVINNTSFAVLLYEPDKITPITEARIGDYVNFEVGYNLTDFALKNLTVETVTKENINSILADTTYLKKSFNEFKSMMDTSFISTRNNAAWLQCLISLSVYIILGFFMGLMIFILTRGKRNYFNILSFLDCQKINAISMFAPGLLGLILGFIFPQYSIMFFIIFLGLRTMWMSMRQLRPTY